MKNNIIVTSSSNRFSPWLLNFIGSVQNNYPKHEKIIIYSLGLNKLFLNEIKSIKNVEIREIPKLVHFWRKSFTWKLLMYEDLLNLKDKSILYIDSGATIIKPLDEIFDLIKKNGYFFIDQGNTDNLTKTIPKDYINKFNIKIDDIENKYSIAAGFTGLNTENETIKKIFLKSSNLAKKGYCLGKGINKNSISRNCEVFRFDQTILSMILFNEMKNPKIHEMYKYGGSPLFIKGQLVYSHRRKIKKLPYLNKIKYKKYGLGNELVKNTNRFLIFMYFKLEKILVTTSIILNKIK